MAATANGSWAYAVPIDETNGYAPAPRNEEVRPRASQTSGFREMRTTASRRPSDYNIMSDTEATDSRRASIRSNNVTATRKRSRRVLKEKRDVAEPSVDSSAWIHRDKLAQIEIQEMQDAGIDVRRPRRTNSEQGKSGRASRSQSRAASRSQSRARVPEQWAEEDEGEQAHAGAPSNAYTGFDDFQRQPNYGMSAVENDEGQAIDSELRTPEEVAAEQQYFRQQPLRPSTSRIPVSKASPLPVSQNGVTRSRQGSVAAPPPWDDSEYSKLARSNSVGSAALLDDEGAYTPSRPASSGIVNANENSPPKARLPNKSTPTSGARKAPAGVSNGTPRPTSGSKPRTSSTLARPRPTSSGFGHKARPSTGHQVPPEGEAPWIASMYKPDPRLPPDQQMLPTHAKRLQQDQWERDGKTGTAYDREFRLLNDAPFQQPKDLPPPPTLDRDPAQDWRQPSPQQQQQQRHARASPAPSPKLDSSSRGGGGDGGWPLSPKSEKSETASLRPGTSGGYKTTPTISSPPAIQRSPMSVQNATFPHDGTYRMPDLDEKAEAKPKKGCCCIIM